MNMNDNSKIDELCVLLKVEAGWFPEFNGYTAPLDFLLEVAKGVLGLGRSSKIVECGGGISTLVIARCLQLKGSAKFISLDHDPQFAAQTENWLTERGLGGVVIEVKHLVGDPPWYAPGALTDEPIDLIVIDGPPGYIHPESRYGARVLFPLLREGGLIYIDDAQRDIEIVKKWASEFLELVWTTKDTERGLIIGKKGERKKKVLVAVPNSGHIHKLVSFALLKIQLDKRYNCMIIQPTHSPSDNNRHHIFNDFVTGDFDYLLMIDSDNPPINNPLDLVELDKDIMSCPTPVWHFTDKIKGERPIYENSYKYVPEQDAYTEWPDKVGLQKVDAVGTGCVLIARRVLIHPKMREGANQRTLNKDGTVDKGGDIMFCERARACGFEIFAHYNYRCNHFVELELHEVARAFYGVYKGND